MTSSTLVLDEVASALAGRALAGADGTRIEPLVNRETGHSDGLLVQTPLERVVAVTRNQPVLSLSDVSAVRRLMARAQARRALLYVPVGIEIANPVMLLASLSRIRIVQVTVADPDR